MEKFSLKIEHTWRLCMFSSANVLLILMLSTAQPVKAAVDEQCLIELIMNADPTTSVGEIRQQCGQQQPNTLASDKSLSAASTQTNRAHRLLLTPHKANYLLPLTYNSNPRGGAFDVRDDELDHEEIKYQFSVKVPIATGISDFDADIYFAYTQLSLWQAYNTEVSSPFRETNYEPEFFITAENDQPLLGFTNISNSFGLVHQSNGQSGNLSRSWNRFYVETMFNRGDFTWSIKPWWRIPESDKDSPADVGGDDNPNIEHFMGYFEWSGLYQWRDHNFSLLLRNNLRSDNRGAFQLGWSFPVSKHIRLYAQYFNGYGESLINFDQNINRLGFGFELTNWQ